jgi:hypothetical protein
MVIIFCFIFSGFKAAGDPNRLNVGELDLAPPVSMKKKR